jgi:hypothetical protein
MRNVIWILLFFTGLTQCMGESQDDFNFFSPSFGHIIESNRRLHGISDALRREDALRGLCPDTHQEARVQALKAQEGDLWGKMPCLGLKDLALVYIRGSVYQTSTVVLDDLVRKTCGTSCTVNGIPILVSTDAAITLNEVAWRWTSGESVSNLSYIALHTFLSHKLCMSAYAIGQRVAPFLPALIRESQIIQMGARIAVEHGSQKIVEIALNTIADSCKRILLVDYSDVLRDCRIDT